MATSATADGVSLTIFARAHLDPVLKAAGARKKGRRYEFSNDHGDVAWFELYSRGWTDGVGFDASVSVNPATSVEWWGWRQREAGFDYVPTYLDARLWTAEVPPPPEAEIIGHWGFRDSPSAESCGRALAAAVESWVIPWLYLVQDRRAFLAAVEGGVMPSPHRMSGTPQRTRVLLTIDEGPSAELDAAMDAVERDRDVEFLRWARLRLNRAPARSG